MDALVLILPAHRESPVRWGLCAGDKLVHSGRLPPAEKLAAPTEVRKNRRTIARCPTILKERGSVVATAVGPDGAAIPEAVLATGRRSKKRTKSGK